MHRRPVLRRVLLACATLLLTAIAWGTVSGALRQLPRAHTVGQRVETAVQLGCGLLSLLAVVTCFWWRRRAAPVRTAWGLSLVAVAGLSSLVWGSPMPLTGLLFASAALLVALAVNWALRTALAA